MKRTRITIIACALALMPLASCGLLTKNVKTEKQLPTDRENVDNSDSVKPYRSTALERGEISGEWAVKTVAGHEAKGEMAPYLLFDPKSGRVYGNNGCNTINGQYDVNPADSTLRFSALITTMRFCAESYPTETDINTAMENVRRYSWTFTPGLNYTLSLLDGAGKTLMTLQRQDFSFLNGTWRVTSINGKSEDNPDIVLVFDIAEQKLHGNTGCNILNGEIAIDMGEHNSLTLLNLATTRMACPEGSSETALLVALEEVMYARPVNANECQLIDGQGSAVITLVRVSDTDTRQ